MVTSKEIEAADQCIAENIESLTTEYYKGVNRPDGLNRAYAKVNALLPHDFRESIPLSMCCLVNTGIKSLLVKRNEFGPIR